MPWDTNLSPKQIDAIRYFPGHVRILAGPGTGKTTVLAHRVVFLVEEFDVDSSNIQFLTFTRAAVGEIKAKLLELGLLEEEFPRVENIHSFALRVLVSNREFTRLPRDLKIVDRYEEEILIYELQRILRRPLTGDNGIRTVKSLYEAGWNTLDTENDDWLEANIDHAFRRELATLEGFYGCLFPSETIVELKRLLERNPDIVRGLDISHLLIDEFQDLNKCDLEVIKYIANAGANLYVVGDDDQSIYSFRQAYPIGIRNFESEYEDVEDFYLTTCYRCGEHIISLGEGVIEKDLSREPKPDPLTPYEENEPGERTSMQFRGPRKEAIGVAELCSYLTGPEVGMENKDVLILLCNKRIKTMVIEEFENRELDYIDLALYESIIDKQDNRLIYSTLRLSYNTDDNLAAMAFLDIARKTTQGFGSTFIDNLRDYCAENGLSIYEGLVACFNNSLVLCSRQSLIEGQVSTLFRVEEQIDELDSLMEKVLYIASEFNVPVTESEFIDRLTGFVNDEGISTVPGLINKIHTMDKSDELSGECNSIRIMTIYKAKGLNAKVVFIVGLEEPFIPRDHVGEKLNEQIRLLYVSITRAKERLYLTHCRYRMQGQQYGGRGRRQGDPVRVRSNLLDDVELYSVDGEQYVNNIISQRGRY